jgi:hypothetical protein
MGRHVQPSVSSALGFHCLWRTSVVQSFINPTGFTLDVYGHVMPGQQADAAKAVAKLVDG